MEIAVNTRSGNDSQTRERHTDSVAGGPLVAPSAEPSVRTRVIVTKPQVPLNDQELRARIQWAHRSSSHFLISYDRTIFNEKRIAMLNDSLEIAYSLIFHFTHESFRDRFQVYAIDQRSSALLGRVAWSHFNFEERAIYLVENSTHSLYSELGSLLAHAMRIARYERHYFETAGWATMEEGFSIFLSERLSIQPDIFPFFSAEPDLIAHRLYGSHPSLLPTIWTTLPNALHLEDRILAGAFLLYLGDTFGDDHVVTFSKSNDAISNETFQSFFHSSLSDLEAGWLQHLPVALVALTETERQAMLQHWEGSIESCHH